MDVQNVLEVLDTVELVWSSGIDMTSGFWWEQMVETIGPLRLSLT